MKNIVESPEVFEAYARIDCCYYMIQEINSKLLKKSSPIEKAVDMACGVHRSVTDDLIGLLEQIIEDKKFVGAEVSTDEDTLKKLVEMKTQLSQ